MVYTTRVPGAHHQSVNQSFMNMNNPRVAIVGATGAVGVEILSCLETRNFPLASLKLLASHRSAGKQVAFRGEMLTVQVLKNTNFEASEARK